MKSCEVTRHNISAKQFHTYCTKKLEEKGMYMEVEWEDFAEPKQLEELHTNYLEDGRVETIKIKPFEWVLCMRGQYKFIIEWNDNIGYMYSEWA